MSATVLQNQTAHPVSKTTFQTGPELTALSATELAALIAHGEVSATQAVEAHIARIEQVNPKLNAVVVKRYAEARAEAKGADEQRARGKALGVLHGVPVTIKESLDVAGTPSTFGLESRKNASAAQDESHVEAMRRAGAIILGKTNVAQMLMYYESDNPVYGRTNNPWNLERTPGGSSGGEGAIIAGGGSMLGLGTDIGGSVRVPAHFSGIASLKPTAGRTPDPGRYSFPIGQQAIASQVGVLARTVRDVAAGLSVINSANVEPAYPLGDWQTVDVSKLRIAFFEEDGIFAPAPAVRRAVREAADALRGMGARVMPLTAPPPAAALAFFYGVLAADGLGLLTKTLGRNTVDPRIKLLQTIGGLPNGVKSVASGLLDTLGQKNMAGAIRLLHGRDVAGYWELVEAIMDYREQFRMALDKENIDAILSPVVPLPAFPHGASNELGVSGSYTILYNVLGYPAGVVPMTRVRPDEEVGRKPSQDSVEKVALKVETGSAGLPVGVQIAARPWREHVALAVMAALEGQSRTKQDFPRTPIF